MSGGEFLGGVAMFAGVGGAAGFTAWRIVSRRASHLDSVERAAAVTLLFLALVIGVHLVPLLLGILGRGTVLVAGALVAAGGLLVRAAPGAAPEPPRPVSPESNRVSRVLAAATTLAVAVAIVADARELLPKVILGSDTLLFHLPNAARFMQSGSLWQVDQFLPLVWNGNYPNHGEVLYVWAMLPFDNDVLVRGLIVCLLGAWALMIVAVARELGAPPASRALGACALITIPIVGQSTVERAMPDVVAYLSLTAALLFLLRHARTKRRSDLVFAGLGLGIATGTKWYGLVFAFVAVVAFAIARRLDGASARDWVRDTALVGGLAAASGGIWLVRNLVESDNPVFPAKVAPLGITIFDAPRDTVTERIGFSISDYFTDPDVLGKIPGEIYEGIGLLAAVSIVLLGVTIAALRKGGNGRIGALLCVAAALAVAYTFLPYTAFGLEGEPTLANVSTRYLVPALICLVAAACWSAGRSRAGPAVDVALAAAALAELSAAYGPLRAGGLVVAALVLVAGAGAIALVRATPSLRRPAILGVASGALMIGAVAYAHRTEQRFNDGRYNTLDPTFAAIDRAGGGLRIGLSGRWSEASVVPVWPSFGERIENHVEYVGDFKRNLLTAPSTGAAFGEIVGRRDFDLVVVGRGSPPRRHVREQDWARRAGFVEVTRSPNLILYGTRRMAARL